MKKTKEITGRTRSEDAGFYQRRVFMGGGGRGDRSPRDLHARKESLGC